MGQNKTAELEHARRILHNPEFYWNSATTAGQKGSLRRAEWIEKAAGFTKGLRVLEVGCGTGFFSERFAASAIELYAIDLSPELLEKAKQRCGERVHFSLCDIESLPFGSESFDAVVGVRVLHHLNLKMAFKEISRTLKKNGVIAFCEPNMLNPQIFIQKNVPWIKKWMGDTPDETAFFKWPLKRFLEGHGFKNIKIEPFDFLHPWTPSFLTTPVEKIGFLLEKTPGLREIAGSLQIFAKKTN